MPSISRDQAWTNIFDRYNILSKIRRDNFADITADEIKAVDGKEARLMAKVDFREHLPSIMREENLSILAINNGTYRIAQNDPFIDIDRNIHTNIIEVAPPQNIMSIDPYNIRSESAALDIAAISNMLNIVFGQESHLAVRGRLRGSLAFNIGTTPYDVNGVQIEVDGGYESLNAIHLLEAKIGYSNNINIRQLLYPKLYWEAELRHQKEVKSYVFYLQNDIYRFIPYHYDGAIGYVDHSEEKAFRFIQPLQDDFSLYNIQIDESKVDMTVPFPQADRFENINAMLMLLSDNDCVNKQILDMSFDIVPRQIDYYYNALKWMKLFREQNDCLILTDSGRRIADLPFRERNMELAKIVFSEPIMNDILNHRIPNENYYARYRMNSDSTIKRRIQTVKAWVNYFKSIFDE